MVKCPECGSYMYIREGSSKFYGCGNFPECRKTLQLYEADEYDDGKTVEEVAKEQSENQTYLDSDYDRAFSAGKISGMSDFEAGAYAKNFEDEE